MIPFMYHTPPMARVHGRRGTVGPRGSVSPRKPARLPISFQKKNTGEGELWTRLARAAGVLTLCLLVGALGFAGGGYLGLIKSVDGFEEPSKVSTYPTYIYSAPLGSTEGSRRVIGTILRSENRKTASLEEMPPSLLNALVAKEDERFREHGGVDLWGIMRALYVDIRAGEAVEGASTITQQYVKNAYLSQERSLSRKLKEALIAIEIERRYEKDEILRDYLNTVYFGNNAYGAEAAAETYFDKPVEDLTVAQSATLVGMLWSPSTLGEDREAAAEQRDLVIEMMFGDGYITRQDRDDALREELPRKWPASPVLEPGLTGPQPTEDFAEMVQDELVERYGANTVFRGGLSVYTALDLRAQVAARSILYGPTGYLSGPRAPDAALVSIEPETGQITAMVGDGDQGSEFNLATQARRQPGSSFKPFALIAALEQGIDPTTRFVSEKKDYDIAAPGGGTERWEVENYGGAERGSISLEEALWQSDNTVFTDLAMNEGGRGLDGGVAAVVDVAKRLGISADFGSHPHPSVVLGTQEVSPIEMASAYATIANGGRRIEPTAISKVVRNEGRENEKVLYTAPEHRGKQVIDPEVAAKATEIMTGDITRGIATEASLGERPVAGKTGTSENFFDTWFVGYTPQLATSVWMGYAEGGRTLAGLLGPEAQQGGTVASPTLVWHDYMERALEGKPIKQFEGVNAAPDATTTQTLAHSER